MGSVFQRRHKVHVTIQHHQKRMAEARALVALRVLQQVHSRLLAMSRFPQEYDLVADQRGERGGDHAGGAVGRAADGGNGGQRHDQGEQFLGHHLADDVLDLEERGLTMRTSLGSDCGLLISE